MQHAIVEGHGVDQRLQGRARRAMGAHQIDLACAAEIVRARPARRPRRRCGCRSRPRRSRAWSAMLAALVARELGEGGLQLEAHRRRHDGAGRLAGQPRRQMRRMHRHGEPPVGHRRGSIAMSRSEASITPCCRPRTSTRSRRGLRRGRRAVGAAALGRLRDGDQQGRLGGVELLRLLAEIGEGGGTHAFEIAAHRRQREVDRQHLALGVAPFELQGARRLDRLGEQAARPRLEQAGGLHGERRGTGDDAAARDPCSAARAVASGSTPRWSSKRRSS